ncbi:MAG: hypothetical protein LBN07_04385 [Christensenellaceae bacterium]|nr:hypothetical protein [Christensenellaceae bacterium]
MGKEVVFDVKAEEVLKEGKMISTSIFKNQTYTEFPYKYAITEKGIWIEEKALFGTKAAFLSFVDVRAYACMNNCCILYPKKGVIPTNVYFDDFAEAIKIVEKYVPKLMM